MTGASSDPSLLLIRFSAIGDCVMAAWAATAFRQKFPNGTLVWAVERRCQAVIDQTRLVTTLDALPRDQWKEHRWSPATWRAQLVSFSRLRAYRCDWGLDLQGHSKTALALRIAAPRQRLMVRATDQFAALLNPVLPPPSSPLHTVEINHLALQSFGDFELPAHPLMPHSEPVDPNLISISVSAGQQHKAWALDRWVQVAENLIPQGFRVVFVGGPGDPHPPAGLGEDRVGQLPLAETVALVARSAFHLSADTGTGHMAAAYGVPSISVFGPTDPHLFRPYAASSVVLRGGDHTTNSVTASEVIDAAQRLIASSRLATSKSLRPRATLG